MGKGVSKCKQGNQPDSGGVLNGKREEDNNTTKRITPRKVVTAEEWINGWKENVIGFHEGIPNDMLMKHTEKLLNGRSSLTIFVPLCGKAVDMKFLYDAGHTVVGVEVAEQALRDFFTENNMEYTVEKFNKSNACVYKSSDERIRLYCMDLYDFSRDIENGMQAIWDRGSLAAINQEDRKRYADLLVTLMAEDCRYFLLTYLFDEERFPGPPHPFSFNAVNELFQEKCKVTEVETVNLDDQGRKTRWNLDELYESLFLITPKEDTSSKKAPNPYHGNTEYTELAAADWIQYWKDDKIFFHSNEPQKTLLKHFEKLTNGRTDVTIFFPLCGKSVDMKFVHDAGHSVVGVEVAENAIQEFFSVNKLEYTVTKLDKIKGSLYKSIDGRIRLYCVDFFDFSSDIENTIEAVWDRGSLTAVNTADRQRYADLMTSLMSDDCQYLLLAYNYDQEKYAGPPHAVSRSTVDQMFGGKCLVSKVDTMNILQDKHKARGMDWFEEDLYVITPKT